MPDYESHAYGTDRLMLRVARGGVLLVVETFMESATTTTWVEEAADWVATPGGWVRRMTHGPFKTAEDARAFILNNDHATVYGKVAPAPDEQGRPGA